MFEPGIHSIPWCIVSLAQPWVQSIVQEKTHASTEFGSNLHIRLVDSYARIKRLDFDSFNELGGLRRLEDQYRGCYGCYLKRILADNIHRSYQTLAFCKEHGIRLSGSTLGEPPKNSLLSRQSKKRKCQDNCDYDIVEDIFGTRKTTYGLARIMACL